MGQILDPTNSADDAAYQSINTLLGTSFTIAEIDANPLFCAAEDDIIELIPEAIDRNYANRDEVVKALVFCVAAKFKSSDPTLRSLTEDVGEERLTETYADDSQSNQSDFFLRECHKILRRLGVSADAIANIANTVTLKARLTASRL